MRSLKVALDYSRSDPTAVLPFRVLDAEGALVAEGATRSLDDTSVEVPEGSEPLFVRLTWPSGRTETKRVGAQDEVLFSDDAIGQNEWSSWAATRLGPSAEIGEPSSSSRAPSRAADTPGAGISRYDDNWMRLWRFTSGVWQERGLAAHGTLRSDHAIQIDLDLDSCGWCLQVGGTRVPWVLVSLPGNGRCRVLITPNESSDPRALPLKVVVSGFRTDAEMLMEFLARDSIRAARAVADRTGLARDLVRSKYADPIAAVAGAYYLLRTGGAREVPIQWFENLSRDFDWLPDGAIIHCVALLRSGGGATSKSGKLLAEALRRGVPVFAEGLSLLQEAVSSLQQVEEEVRSKVASLAAAEAWAGATFSFFGADPEQPSAERIVGTPGKSKPAGALGITHFSEIR